MSGIRQWNWHESDEHGWMLECRVDGKKQGESIHRADVQDYINDLERRVALAEEAVGDLVGERTASRNRWMQFGKVETPTHLT